MLTCISLEQSHIREIWEQENSTGGFAVIGELTREHRSNEIALFYELNPELRRVSRQEVIAEDFVAAALDTLGLIQGVDAP